MAWKYFQRISLAALCLAGTVILPGARQADQHQLAKKHGYVLELLWWPEYCHEHPERRYCAGASFRGFVPSDLSEVSSTGDIKECTTTTTSFTPNQELLKLVPDEVLLRSEWDKHGACSGFPPTVYFGRLARVFKSVAIPKQFVWPDRDFQMSAAEIEQAFLRVNREISPNGVFVFCRSGFLSSIQIQGGEKLVVPNGVCKDAHVEIIARMPLAE